MLTMMQDILEGLEETSDFDSDDSGELSEPEEMDEQCESSTTPGEQPTESCEKSEPIPKLIIKLPPKHMTEEPEAHRSPLNRAKSHSGSSRRGSPHRSRSPQHWETQKKALSGRHRRHNYRTDRGDYVDRRARHSYKDDYHPYSRSVSSSKENYYELLHHKRQELRGPLYCPSTRRPGIARSLTKLRIPSEMRRYPNEAWIATEQIRPRSEPILYFAVSQLPSISREIFTDPISRDIIESGSKSTSLRAKKMNFKTIVEKFSYIKAVVSTKVNFGYWYGIRSEVIANSGLSVLCHLVDETMTWLQQHIIRGIDTSSDSDVILCSADKLTRAFVEKIAAFAACGFTDSTHRALIRQIRYLVTSTGDCIGAAYLMLEVKCETHLLIVLAYALCLSVLTQNVKDPELLKHMTNIVESYKPGQVASITTSILELHSQCTNLIHRMDMRALFGDYNLNKGLFFIPFCPPSSNN